VVWRDGEPIELPNLTGDTAGARGRATCITNDGVIGGSVETGDGSQAVLWIDDVAQPLSHGPDGPAESVNRVNEAGTVLASWRAPGDEDLFERTFALWRGDDVTVLGRPEEATEDFLVLARSLNGRDQVLFLAVRDLNEPEGSFFFIADGESFTVVDGRDDGFGSFVADMNDDGVVSGYTYAEEKRRAARWENGEVVDLNDVIAADTGLTLTHANAINNAGMIAGLAEDADGIQHGYLLIPS
jgi:hypothetical protein